MDLSLEPTPESSQEIDLYTESSQDLNTNQESFRDLNTNSESFRNLNTNPESSQDLNINPESVRDLNSNSRTQVPLITPSSPNTSRRRQEKRRLKMKCIEATLEPVLDRRASDSDPRYSSTEGITSHCIAYCFKLTF